MELGERSNFLMGCVHHCAVNCSEPQYFSGPTQCLTTNEHSKLLKIIFHTQTGISLTALCSVSPWGSGEYVQQYRCHDNISCASVCESHLSRLPHKKTSIWTFYLPTQSYETEILWGAQPWKFVRRKKKWRPWKFCVTKVRKKSSSRAVRDPGTRATDTPGWGHQSFDEFFSGPKHSKCTGGVVIPICPPFWVWHGHAIFFAIGANTCSIRSTK